MNILQFINYELLKVIYCRIQEYSFYAFWFSMMILQVGEIFTIIRIKFVKKKIETVLITSKSFYDFIKNNVLFLYSWWGRVFCTKKGAIAKKKE